MTQMFILVLPIPSLCFGDAYNPYVRVYIVIDFAVAATALRQQGYFLDYSRSFHTNRRCCT